MADVFVQVAVYPFDGATGIVIEERTPYGWVARVDTATIGTYPNYTHTYEVSTPGHPLGRLRYRWRLAASAVTSWLSPEAVYFTPSTETAARLRQAVIAKAARIYALAEAPLGTHGEMTEFGAMRVMADHQIVELLAGLIRVDWWDAGSGVTVADVVRALGYDELPDDKEGDITRAIDAAESWIAHYLHGAVAIV